MGHMYLPMPVLEEEAGRILKADGETVSGILKALILEDALIAEKIEEDIAVYLPRFYTAECETARLLGRRQWEGVRRVAPDEDAVLSQIADYEREEGVTLCAQQREAALSAVREGVLIITGGPGTGKTTSINLIIRLMRDLGQVELCAPTGRAARRMSEATGHPARTIHRLLEYNGESQGFARDADNPLDADVVIVDEMSMVDIFLMRALLCALRPGARLILVGDADQLPSVGAGNVLRDLIAAHVTPWCA